VLIAGGVDHPDTVTSAELYDPSSGKFTETGSMTTGRSYAAATRLADGRVLIAGGDACNTLCTMDDSDMPLNSAELYDPATGKFTATGSMSEARDFFAATLLPDGRVLVVGGYNNVVEAYDPATGKFSAVGTLLNELGEVTTALLPNGKVLVLGNRVEIFDPATGRSESLPSLTTPTADPEAIQGGAAITLEDGSVLIQASESTDEVTYWFMFDPATGAFSTAGSIDADFAAGVLLRDGRVLLTGGSRSADDSTNLSGLYDPSGGFQPLKSETTLRCSQTMTVLVNGTVLIAGGYDDNAELSDEDTTIPLSSAVLFKP
jgi:WD40 repeat protein